MAYGYAGKILKINLTTKEISRLDTAQYEEFGGGTGIGAAIFWDLAVAPGDWDLQDAFDPKNVISLMTGPLAATGVPGAGRTSICAIAPETFPTPLFHRTGMGGRFGTMLKLAGWDGVVVHGRAERPVWINVINDKVTIEDAKSLWGLNTYETQGQILSMVGGRTRFGEEWHQIGDDYTTARPQIVCIGPVGESMTRVAALIHGSGVSARTGGFGGVFGSKNLKAISVMGTGSIQAADPKRIVDTRISHILGKGGAAAGTAACMPCVNSDRKRDSYYGGESMCADQYWFMGDLMKGADVAIKWGICTWATKFGGAMENKVVGAPALFKGKVPMEPGMGWYIKYLYELGVLGPGKKIESHPLPMDQWDKLSFREAFCDAIARKIGIGADLAEGTLEAAKRWGRLEEDLNSGALRFPAYGASWHHTLPGMDWAYGYILTSGDPMWHGLMSVSGGGGFGGGPSTYTAEQLVEMMAAKVVPFTGDPLMFSNSWKGEEARKTGIYSEHKAKLVAWARRYNEFYNESLSICEMMLPNFIGRSANSIAGPSPELEYSYYQAVTGNKKSLADTIEIGRKIWNMQRAIRVMAGRHRDKEQFAPFMHMPGATFMSLGSRPVYVDGKWSFENQDDMYLDKTGVEEFKTHFYKLEGWDASNGWPTRNTLEGLGMKKIADTMASKNKLGV
jgi:aldehyde:ferredoxin oxidoreductase